MIEDRRQRLRRARPMLALATVSFAVGAIVAGNHGGSGRDAAALRFVRAWTRHDYLTMYDGIDAASQRDTTPSEFAALYEHALATATANGLTVAGRPHAGHGGLTTVPVLVRTRLFGTLSLDFALPLTSSEGLARIAWSRSLAFPGLRGGETLSRRSVVPRRAGVLARDGSVLAEGGQSGEAAEASTPSSPLGELASAVLGKVGPAPTSRRAELEAQGFPASAPVGLSGLERALDERLRGTPGGTLMAGERVLARAAPRQAQPVRSSVSPAVQRAAVAALGGQYGGIVALDPRTGEILAVAGIGLDGLQPPGSTFKLVTLTGVLEARLANPRTTFPYATYATLDGVKLSNANGEECGGSLELAFAVSCNSVFSPLGVKLGATRLVSTAERLGFNRIPSIAGAAESTLPAASQIHGELALGSTAIGQGQVLATPLQMASVAATIADGGRAPAPTFLHEGASTRASASTGGAPAMSAATARTIRRLMLAVVREGTGTAAAIPGVEVAGKTGTAELKSSCSSTSSASGEAEKQATTGEGCKSEAANTDAWFAAFAPATHPRVAVCVLLVKDGAGGDTAAPVARQVIEAALQAGSP